MKKDRFRLLIDRIRFFGKVIPLVKVLWMNHGREEATCECEDQMQTQYPHLF